MNISDEAVEVAACDFYMSGPQGNDLHWDDLPRQRKGYFLRRAKIALEAAAPYMLAQALDELAADVKARGDIGKDGGLEAWDYLTWKAEQLRTTK